jgi:5-carboxyvanillate decarboxylase
MSGAYRRIATEEAWAIPEQMDAMRRLAEGGSTDPDFALWRVLLGDSTPSRNVMRRLLDVGPERLAAMDEHGVDVQLLLLTSPGPQMFDADTGTELATLANDRLAEAVRAHPGRFAGLAAVAPQDPWRAVRELERAMTRLGLNGIVINSHIHGEYLDELKYWPILEAAAALEAPIYIHPRAPSRAMAGPYARYHLEDAIWGFQAEAGLHGIRLIMSGVFDRYPKLRIVLGHMGEGIPYWLHRVDYMHRSSAGSQMAADRGVEWRPKLRLRPSDYFRQNFLITTSGVNYSPVLEFCLRELGADNILWAIDYPYQQVADATAFMDAAPIPDEDKRRIYHRNAERVFRIPER